MLIIHSNITVKASTRIKAIRKRIRKPLPPGSRSIAAGRPSRRTTQRKYPTGVVKSKNRYAARLTLEDWHVDDQGNRTDKTTGMSHRRRYLHLGTRSTVEEAEQLYREGKAFYEEHGFVLRSDLRKVSNNRIVWKQFHIEGSDGIAYR